MQDNKGVQKEKAAGTQPGYILPSYFILLLPVSLKSFSYRYLKFSGLAEPGCTQQVLCAKMKTLEELKIDISKREH